MITLQQYFGESATYIPPLTGFTPGKELGFLLNTGTLAFLSIPASNANNLPLRLIVEGFLNTSTTSGTITILPTMGFSYNASANVSLGSISTNETGINPFYYHVDMVYNTNVTKLIGLSGLYAFGSGSGVGQIMPTLNNTIPATSTLGFTLFASISAPSTTDTITINNFSLSLL